MASDTSVYGNTGTDSSGSTVPTSPLSDRNGGADPDNINSSSPGSLDFDPVSLSGKATSDE